jgi:hypothetical protein
MVDLKPGWSFGEGLPVSPAAAALAELYLLLVSGRELRAEVFPNPDGGCAVAFYRGDERVELCIHADGLNVDMTVERGIGFDYEDSIEPVMSASLEEIMPQLVRLSRGERWSLRGSLTYGSTTRMFGAFDTPSSETPRPLQTDPPLRTAKGGSQSLKPLVPVPA